MIQTLRCLQCSSTTLDETAPGQYRCHHCGTHLLMNAGGQLSSTKTAPPPAGPSKRQLPRVMIVAGVVAGLLVVLTAALLQVRPIKQSTVIEVRPGDGAPVPIISGPVPGKGAAGNGASATTEGPAPVRPAEFGAEAIQKPPAVTAKLEGFTPVPDSIGNLYFIGLVRNTGEVVLEHPKVQVTLFDKKGEKLIGGTGFAVRDRLPPGEESPVKVLVSKAPPYHDFQAEIEPAAASYPRPTTDLTFNQVRLTPQLSRGYTLEGRVTNAGGLPVRHVEISALLFDKEKRIVGMDSRYLAESTLEPAETSPFRVEISLVKGEPASFRIYADYLARDK